jgi:TATA-binding protein-associated factor Taf7
MPHFLLCSYPERTGAHYSAGISPPYNYSKNSSVIKRFGKRMANKLKGEGFVLVQLQDERAEQVRCKLIPEEARHMARELRQFANELEACRRRSGMNKGRPEKGRRQLL